MIRYIHCSVATGKFGLKDFLVSDNRREDGFTLFIEFSCENADTIINDVISGYRMKRDSHLVKGELPSFFRRVLSIEMTEEKRNLKIPYEMKIHHDDHVAVYSRVIQED